jgi:uncharacterized ion transporter superfamily protein YfcC
VFALAFGVMIYGVIPWADLGVGLPTLWWWFPEMTASFLLFSIMNNGQITDTVLRWVERALGDTGEAVFSVVMFLLFLPLSFLIPSSSGLASIVVLAVSAAVS